MFKLGVTCHRQGESLNIYNQSHFTREQVVIRGKYLITFVIMAPEWTLKHFRYFILYICYHSVSQNTPTWCKWMNVLVYACAVWRYDASWQNVLSVNEFLKVPYHNILLHLLVNIKPHITEYTIPTLNEHVTRRAADSHTGSVFQYHNICFCQMQFWIISALWAEHFSKSHLLY